MSGSEADQGRTRSRQAIFLQGASISREMPYHPIGQKVSSTTPEQMFAKLEARNSQIRNKAGEAPKEQSLMALDREIVLATRLRQHTSQDIFDGLTTIEQRRERVRTAILSNALSSVHAGKRQGASINFAQLFELTYQEPL
jgi:hypothetical protein